MSDAEKIDKAIEWLENEIEFNNSVLMQETQIDEASETHKLIDIQKFILQSLETLTQLRARLQQLNEPVVDEHGVKHHQCSPYNVERLKKMLVFMGENQKQYNDKTDARLKYLQHEYDSTRGLWCIDQDPKTVSKEWIEQNAFQLELKQ